MQSIHSPTGYESSVTDRRTLGGLIAFVGLIASILLAASHPGIAAAAALGAISAHVGHHVARGDR